MRGRNTCGTSAKKHGLLAIELWLQRNLDLWSAGMAALLLRLECETSFVLSDPRRRTHSLENPIDWVLS